MRPSVVLIAGLAALPLLAVPRSAAAQSGFHPRWEIPGLDFRQNGAWRIQSDDHPDETAAASDSSPVTNPSIGPNQPQPRPAVKG